MTRDEKVAEAHRLKASGLLNREIAERFGVTTSCVTKWLNPNKKEWDRKQNAKRGPAKREWESNNRAPCPSCGRQMGAGSRCPSARPKLCSECENLNRLTRGDERARMVEKWWAEGLSQKEIAARLGWEARGFGGYIDRLRARGYNLPYRYRAGTKNATAHPEQVR